jgi:hypothetical protein
MRTGWSTMDSKWGPSYLIWLMSTQATMDVDNLAGQLHDVMMAELQHRSAPIIWVDATHRALPSIKCMQNNTVLFIALIIDDLQVAGEYIIDSVVDFMNVERNTCEIPSVHVLKVFFNFPGKNWQNKMGRCGEKVGEALMEILE